MEARTPLRRKNTSNLTKVQNDMKKYYSSKFIRNSATNFLENFQKTYGSKYFSSSNKYKKRDTFKTLLNNNISESSRKIMNISKNVNDNDNNIGNYLDKLYQNENHLKKNILKKKKEEHSKKKPRVSFKNFTPKPDIFKFKKRLNFFNYVNDKMNDKDNNLLLTKPNENLPEEEDGQSYGYNKKYSLKMIDENDKDNEKSNVKEYTPKISSFNKLKSRDIDLEENNIHKIFNTINFKDKEIANRTFKKSKSRTFLKRPKKSILSKTPKEQKKKNNNVFNINYNINVKHKKNHKKKNTKNSKPEIKKEESKNKDMRNQVEKIKEENSENKNNEGSMTNKNKTSEDKKGNKDDDKLKETKKKNKYKLNCCFSFFSCLGGNNE